ncbi:MAG: hypothetical protein U9R25_01585 [Chloroflexota bacterium]|nr:hypothetical protein [Chloroflexota bacterium]
MAIVVQLISEYSNWFYALCAIAAVVLLRSAILARRERKHAVFSLEREAALNRTHGIFRLTIILALFMGAIFFISTYLVEAVEPIIAQADPTPTPPFLINTPTQTAAPTSTATVTPTITPTPRPRATPRPIPTAEPEKVQGAVAPANCTDQRAVILEPGAGQQITGPIQVIGTAQTDSFQYFKLEFKPVGGAGDFNFYLSREAAVLNGPLGTWDPSGLPPGPYQLRLVTVDNTGNFGQCIVDVTIGD